MTSQTVQGQILGSHVLVVQVETATEVTGVGLYHFLRPVFPNLCCFNSSHCFRDLLTSSHMPSRRSPGRYYGQFWELCFVWVWAGGQNSWEKYELQACLWRCLSVLMVSVLRVKSSSPAAFFSGRLYENVKSDKLISQLFSVWRRQTSFWQLITRFSTRVRGLFLFTV